MQISEVLEYMKQILLLRIESDFNNTLMLVVGIYFEKKINSTFMNVNVSLYKG
jgi:hypothetical protein